jgi:hypothetical protein
MALFNQYSFIRFSDTNPDTYTAPPQAYIKERDQYPFLPIIVPGENIAFYIGSRYGYDLGATVNLQIVKYNTGEIIGTYPYLQKDLFVGGLYNLYADFTIPALSDGIYQFRAVTAGGAVLLTSNPLLCMNDDYQNVSSYVEFTNDQNLYNVRYAELGNFYQKFRLRITDITGGDYEQGNESYRSVTSGRYRDLLEIPERYYTFEAYYFDTLAFEALSCFLAHRTRLINTKEYGFKANLSHDPILLSKVSKGTFQMYDQSFSTVNKCYANITSS